MGRFKVIPALLIANLLPTFAIIAFILFGLSMPSGDWSRIAIASSVYYCICLAITLFFGCPVHIIFERYLLRSIYNYALVGAILSTSLWVLLDLNLTLLPSLIPMISLPFATAILFWILNRPDLTATLRTKPTEMTQMPAFKVWIGMLLFGLLATLVLKASQVMLIS